MRRPIEDPLPTIYTTSTRTLQVMPRPNTDGSLRLVNGGTISIPPSGIELDIDASGDNGLNAGSSLTDNTFMYLYAYGSGSDAVVTLDDNDPDTGPSGISNYRYICPVKINDSTDLAWFMCHDGVWMHTRSTLVVDTTPDAYTIPGSASDGTWSATSDLTTLHCVPVTADAVLYSMGLDSDTSDQQAFGVTTDPSTSTPSYTPYKLSNMSIPSMWMTWILVGDMGRSTMRWIPLQSGKLYIYWLRLTATAQGKIIILGFQDKYLRR